MQGLLVLGVRHRGYENAGLKLRRMIGEDWRRYPDYSLAVMQQTIDKDPDMGVGIARGIAKATIYALANPDCTRKLHWKHYPATKPSSADEAIADQLGPEHVAGPGRFAAGRFRAERWQVMGQRRPGGL